MSMPYPLPCTYAVVQVDFEATTRDINDPDIVKAARKLSDRKCLILLHSVSTQQVFLRLDSFSHDL